MEGIKVRITAKATDTDGATALVEAEAQRVRAVLGEVVFGTDDETMEFAVAAVLRARGLSLGLAESLTGGLVASRLVNVAGASDWFRGSIVAYSGCGQVLLIRRARRTRGECRSRPGHG